MEIGGLVAAAELDDADALAGTGRLGEIVEARHLLAGEAVHIGAGMRGDSAAEAMRHGLRPRVETEDRGDDTIELGSHRQHAAADAMRGAIIGLDMLELRLEGVVEGGGGAGQHHAAARHVGLGDAEAMGLGVSRDLGDIRGIGAMLGRELFMGQADCAGRRQGRAAAQIKARLDSLRVRNRPDMAACRHRLSFAARNSFA